MLVTILPVLQSDLVLQWWRLQTRAALFTVIKA